MLRKEKASPIRNDWWKCVQGRLWEWQGRGEWVSGSLATAVTPSVERWASGSSSPAEAAVGSDSRPLPTGLMP